jgi:hypothetical protein
LNKKIYEQNVSDSAKYSADYSQNDVFRSYKGCKTILLQFEECLSNFVITNASAKSCKTGLMGISTRSCKTGLQVHIVVFCPNLRIITITFDAIDKELVAAKCSFEKSLQFTAKEGSTGDSTNIGKLFLWSIIQVLVDNFLDDINIINIKVSTDKFLLSGIQVLVGNLLVNINNFVIRDSTDGCYESDFSSILYNYNFNPYLRDQSHKRFNLYKSRFRHSACLSVQTLIELKTLQYFNKVNFYKSFDERFPYFNEACQTGLMYFTKTCKGASMVEIFEIVENFENLEIFENLEVFENIEIFENFAEAKAKTN